MPVSARLSSALLLLLLAVGCLPAVPAAIPIAVPPALPADSGPRPPGVTSVIAQLRGLPVEEFFEESFRQIAIRDPDLLIFTEGSYGDLMSGPYARYGIRNDRFTDISDSYICETQQLQRAILDLLHTYDRSALTYDQQITYDTFEDYLTGLVEGHPYMYHTYPVNGESSWGMSQDTLVIWNMTGMAIHTPQDAEDYLARLSSIDTWTDQLLEALKLRQEAGILPTKFMLRSSLAQLDRGYSYDPRSRLDVPRENILYTSFVERLDETDAISPSQKQAFRSRALAEVENTVIPSWHKLQAYLTGIFDIAPEETGALGLPDGTAYYSYKLRNVTGSTLTPDQIHQLGIAEVARLQKEMRTFAHQELGYPADLTMYELRKRLMQEAGPPDRTRLLETVQDLVDGFEAKKDSYFDIYPSKEIIVKLAYPDQVYNDPAYGDPGPAILRFNFDNPIPRYELPSWLYHETIPGHMLSQLLFHELDLSAPTFHKTVLVPAYLEGWALYVEELAWEMGLYQNDPYGNLGRLEFKILRAARLVVETGIHTRGWSLEQATSYISAATGRPTPPSEATRYIIEPGQGCSYYIGFLKIIELRQRAMDQLGDRFDIREFHNVLLKHGQMPLSVMERVVDDWIASKSGG